MQKVDIAIAVVGAFALVATVLGLVFYDAGLTDYEVESTMTDFSEGGDVPAAGVTYNVDVPDNVYHATMDITIGFSSPNPGAQCTITATVTVTDPLFNEVQETGSWDISSGSGLIAIETEKFGEQPDDFSGDADDKEANTLSWSDPLTIQIDVQDSGCGAPILGVGGAAYTADVAGVFHGYTIGGDLPDIGVN